RPKIEVVRVGKDQLSAERAELVGVQALYGCLRRNRAEDRCMDVTVGGMQDSSSGRAPLRHDLERYRAQLPLPSNGARHRALYAYHSRGALRRVARRGHEE